jgi:hypothetical protein
MIVEMKIRFRIGAKQDGGQSRGQDCPVNPSPLWSPRWPVPTGTPPAKNHAEVFLRRGAACCARLSGADQRHSLANYRSIPAEPNSIPQAFRKTKNSREITQFPVISNRNWLKNRSCRKQKTKPCLTGARTAQCDARFLRDFGVNFLPAEPDRDRPPVARRTIKS